MQRWIAIFGIAIALTPNTTLGAEKGSAEPKQKSGAPYAQNFDGSYVDEPQDVADRKLSKNTEKVMAYMARFGLDSSGVKDVTRFMDDRIDDNNFRLARGQYAGFKMELTHEVAMPTMNKFKLRLSNEEVPHWQVEGSTRGVMLNYKLQW